MNFGLSSSGLALAVLAVGIGAYVVGIARARELAAGKLSALHSRPGYHGALASLFAVVPALALVALWAVIEPAILERGIAANFPPELQSASPSVQSLTRAQIQSLAAGFRQLSESERSAVSAGTATVEELFNARGIAIGSEPKPFMLAAATQYNAAADRSRLLATLSCLALAIAGAAYGIFRIAPPARARNTVEQVARYGLAAASTVAVLTTVGIVLSMLFQSLSFFGKVPVHQFLFGTVWDPRFAAAGDASGGAGGQFGFLPLLWGTLYISAVALIVAVPIGLFAAIYMSEYASRNVRTFVKPALELLAGIPSIVYGFFALVTFGPFLRDLGQSIGVSVSASSVLTAGVVMGIMLIPFVSSLSDDVMSAVPQSLREGSYGLGATQSETIKRVILPAALPGVIGAILLAASRAIGETMIVVLAAGIAANITLNPLEPVTTITVKIVSQLTGDLAFDSPQTLVAFALGLALFVITLGLNIIALHIVRTYREQYE